MNPTANGYITDVRYTYGFYEELSPLHLKFSAAMNGYQTCRIDQAFNYLDLGCGNAISLCLFAAANPHAHFWGVDLMPEHIQFAKDLTKQCGIKNITLLENSFDDLKLRSLPMFDFIATHGTISWINKKTHTQLRHIIDKKLKDNGLFYVSYNTLPGWSSVSPLQKLVSNLTDKDSDPQERLKQGIALLDALRDGKSAFFSVNPMASKELDKIKKSNPHYAIHEFMHDTCPEFYFSEVNQFYNEIGLNFVAHANFNKNIPDMYIPERFHPLLDDRKDLASRQVLEDYIMNTMFRRDVYIKGKQQASTDSIAILDDLYLTSLATKGNQNRSLKLGPIQYEIEEDFSNQLIDCLSGSSMTIKDFLKRPEFESIAPEQLIKQLTACIITRAATVCTLPITEGKQHYSEIINQLNLALLDIIQAEKRPFLAMACPVIGSALRLPSDVTEVANALIQSDYDESKTLEWTIQHHHMDPDKLRRRFHRNAVKMIHDTKANLMPKLVTLGIAPKIPPD